MTAPAAPTPVKPDYQITVEDAGPGTIKVSGWLPGKDEIANLHCAAAKRAISDGDGTLAWVGGLSNQVGGRYRANLVYQTGDAADAAPGATPEEGAAPVASWLKFCDEAGIPREGDA